MITFTFHIIKLNVLSALMICLTMLLGSDHPEALCVAMEILDLATDCPASAVSN